MALAAGLFLSMVALPGCRSNEPASGEGTQRIFMRLQAVEPNLAKYWPDMGGPFPSATARMVTLQIGMLTSGSLDSLFIVSYSPETRQLLTAESFGPSEEYVDIWGALVAGVAMTAGGTTVASCLEAVDRVGRATMLAEMPALPAPQLGTFPGYYLLEAWPRSGGEPDIPADAKAVVWTGSAFQPLTASDPLRRADPVHVRFVITPLPSIDPEPAPFPSGETTTTTEGVDLSPVYFVIPTE